MGTGKTLATLWALDYLMQRGLVRRALILSPLSTIYRVWEDEIFNHFMSRRKCIVLYGDRGKRLASLTREADFYVLNHDGLCIGGSKSNRGYALGEFAQQLKDRGVPGGIIGNLARAAHAAPGQANYHKKK